MGPSAILIVFFIGVLGRQEYKIYQIKKETLAAAAKGRAVAERKRLIWKRSGNGWMIPNILKNWPEKTIIW
jgi:hypothetical protein